MILARDPIATGLRSALRRRNVSAVMQLRVLFIALGRIAQTAIQKLVQEAQQFHLAVHLSRTVPGTLTLQKCPEMFLDQHNRPAEIGKGHPLRGATALTIRAHAVLAQTCLKVFICQIPFVLPTGCDARSLVLTTRVVIRSSQPTAKLELGERLSH